jgi:hypothetical protein
VIVSVPDAITTEDEMTHMSHSPLASLAGPSALGAGVLIVAAQLAMLPFDPADHVATTTDPVFQVGGVVYLVGFLLLLLTLVGLGDRLARAAGAFGTVAVVVALVGTMLLGGDLWFETFAVPWLADQAPASLDAEPTTLLMLGAFTSYLSFAAGWLLVGLAGWRSRTFPVPICLAIAVGGVIGFQALLSPWCVPLALAVGALGVWLLRAAPAAPPAVAAEAPPSEGPPVPG